MMKKLLSFSLAFTIGLSLVGLFKPSPVPTVEQVDNARVNTAVITADGWCILTADDVILCNVKHHTTSHHPGLTRQTKIGFTDSNSWGFSSTGAQTAITVTDNIVWDASSSGLILLPSCSGSEPTALIK